MITNHTKASATRNASQVLNQSILELQTQWQAICMENAINKIYTTKRKIHTDKSQSHRRYIL